MIRLLLICLALLVVAFVPLHFEPASIQVGSKAFTESIVIGDLVAQLAEDAGPAVTHNRSLGGTQIVYKSLLDGQIDVYPEYTGTLVKEIFANQTIRNDDQLRAALAERGVRMSRPLGFSNSYALGMSRERAESLGIQRISDLRQHPDLSFGFSHEFMKRDDGWVPLKTHYGLPHQQVTGLDHDLAYRQLELGVIDVVDVYNTDAKIETMNLQVLEDDLHYFPPYDAVLLYRDQLAREFPQVVDSILRLEGKISEQQMRRLNTRIEVERIPEARAAADFLEHELQISVAVAEPSLARRLLMTTIEHLDLVRPSLIPAIFVAIPLGVLAAKRRAVGHVILAVVGFVQTIPSLALLVMLMPVVASLKLGSVGQGAVTPVVALFLYSLLPIVRNTYAGIHGISGAHLEAAAALGLPSSYRLLHIELPLAAGAILAGVQTAAVINVGFATLGALIGAGGYGQPILAGIRRDDTRLILEGALPAAILALVVQGAFELAERWFLPRGLRMK